MNECAFTHTIIPSSCVSLTSYNEHARFVFAGTMPYYSTVKLKAISDRKAANRPTTTLLQVRSGMTFLAHATRSPLSNIEGGTLSNSALGATQLFASFYIIRFRMI